jgi:diguanylate cyclase (GGDEF)-like protein
MNLEDEIFPEVLLPLASGTSSFGLISLSRKRRDKFTPEECDLLVDLGRVISLVVENKLLLSREWRIMPEDALTGLCTRHHFEARISEEIERVDRYGGVFSVLIAGIDNHEDTSRKKQNSLCSAVLKAIAPLFKQTLRDVDTAARCSEGELAVLLPHTDEEGSLRVANRLISGLRQVEFDGKPSDKVSFSIGAATYPDDSAFRDGLLEAADIALCCARETGGDRVMSCREAKAR